MPPATANSASLSSFININNNNKGACPGKADISKVAAIHVIMSSEILTHQGYAEGPFT